MISSQQNNHDNRLFAKKSSSHLGFILALSLSFCLMVADYRYHYLGIVRNGFSLLISPVQYLVDYPVRIVGWFSSLISTKKALIDENIQLRYQQTMLEAQLQKLLVISHENEQLKKLLSATPSAGLQAMAAEILAVDTSDTRQVLVLNKGRRDGIRVGLPVLDARGVVGQIIDVGLMTSTILVISDSKSAVPVRNNRTGERAILVGMNSLSRLALIHLPSTSSVHKGDLLVTSGLGRLYPEGFPVGKVDKVVQVPGNEFINVMVRPMAQLNHSRLVLVIWPEKEHDALTEEIHERFGVLSKLGIVQW